jgi:hypothetical protein
MDLLFLRASASDLRGRAHLRATKIHDCILAKE